MGCGRSAPSELAVEPGQNVRMSERPDLRTVCLWPRTIRYFRPIKLSVHTGQTGCCQFWSSTYAPLFFGKACLPKNNLLDQNCLRAMINMHRPYFVLRAINSIGHILLLLQADDETTRLGLHTCFTIADLAGITSTCCSMDSFLHIRCTLLFWV